MKLKEKISNGIKNQKGQGMVEYAIIVALIALVVITALSPLGQSIRDAFNGANQSVTGLTTNGGAGNGD